MRTTLSKILVVLAVLLPASAFATSYFVPSDREIIQRAEHIVIATAVSSHAVLQADGGIFTIYELRVNESLKGPLSAGATLRLKELGGRVGDAVRFIPDGVAYEDGKEYLVFTETDGAGDDITLGMNIGRFELKQDLRGLRYTVRGDLFGWDSASLDAHEERIRDQKKFVTYIRGLLTRTVDPRPNYFLENGDLLHPRETNNVTALAFTRASYLFSPSAFRWSTPSASFRTARTQPGGIDGPGSVTQGTGQWTSDPNSNVNYSRGVQDDTATNGIFGAPDGKNTVLFNSTAVPNAVAGIGGIQQSGASYQLDGETFFNITEVDVEMADDQPIAGQNCFNSVMTHELGHTLGFRHSNENGAASPGACPGTSDCTTTAIMNAVVQCSFNGVLRTYDRNAVQTVYGTGPVCTPPSVSSISGTATITSGNSTPLTVVAGGTPTFTYQWFIGASGVTSNPVAGGTSASINVSPTTTTTYWVRITGQCAPTADSSTVTVTVNPAPGCTAAAISTHPAGSTITSGQNASLSVSATGTAPLTFQWFIGTSPSTANPTGTNSSSLSPSPTTTTSYWVRVTNACGSANSNTATITVNPATCIPPSIIAQPTDQTIVSGSTASLSVGHNASSPTITWFQGAPPNTSNPVGSGRVITTAPLTQTTTFYATLTNACGSVTTRTMTVTVAATCTAPSITSVTATPQTISFGLATTLTVVATGTSLSYQWFTGNSGDTSNPINGATSDTVNVTVNATTPYWVRVSSGCGAAAVNSSAVTVTVVACVAPTSLTITAPATVPPGGSATLLANVTGSETLKYQWFQGSNGDTSKPVGTDNAQFATGPLSVETLYWVRVTNACGGADALNVRIGIKAGKRRAAGH